MESLYLIWQNVIIGQQKRDSLGELIEKTLEQFEKYGGEDVFINVKYVIPIYQSSIIL